MSEHHQGTGKPALERVPPLALLCVGAVMENGRQRYPDINGVPNWQSEETQWKISELLGSAERHIQKFKAGLDNDDRSGLPHWAHAASKLLMLGELYERGIVTDDRFTRHGWHHANFAEQFINRLENPSE